MPGVALQGHETRCASASRRVQVVDPRRLFEHHIGELRYVIVVALGLQDLWTIAVGKIVPSGESQRATILQM